MSKMDKFLGKSKECDILGEKVNIAPFKGKELDLLLNLGEKPKGADLIKMVHAALSKTEEVTLEQVGEMSLEAINAFAEAIIEVNGLKEKK